jgi:hypothetical protein
MPGPSRRIAFERPQNSGDVLATTANSPVIGVASVDPVGSHR